MPPLKKHKFNGVEYEIDVDGPFVGICDPPDGELRRAIRLPHGLPAKGRNARAALANLLHECLHACDWSRTDERVDKTAEDIAGLLWKLGFRRKVKKAKE
jgi:hypothetical protein